MEEEKGRVCVTGGTGFIGSWIIKRLLENGYSVNTTVRSSLPEHKKDLRFLTDLPGASQRLQILNADLSEPESFKEAIEGCRGVFHVATPVDFEENEPEEIVTKRSIDGALGILKACLTSKTVKTVIYTSSASAVYNTGKEEEEDDNELIKDESSWSDVDSLRTLKPFGWSYAVSKTLTEKAVLEFGQEHGLDVVSLVPTFVVGPFICPKLPGSVGSSLYFLLDNKDPFSYLQLPMVHVDDVARAHIFLLEHPNQKGRYNCSSCLAKIENVLEIVSARFPQLHVPNIDSMKEMSRVKCPDISSKKLIEAGFEFKYGLEEMLVDAIQCSMENGYL